MEKSSRREFFKGLGCGAAALSATGSSFSETQGHALKERASGSRRPNILFITTDYQRGDDVPSLGNPVLKMPALERLCREGMVFSRYYSTAPICMPARYSLITGRYPHTHGAQENTSSWIPEGIPTLMELLGRTGYTSVGIGKMHFSPWERMAGFQRRIIADRKGNGKADNDRIDDYARFLAAHGRTRWDYLKLQEPADIFGLYDWPFDPGLHIDAYVGAQARAWIENDLPLSPWFLWVSFNGPHNPWDPPAEYSRMYLDKELPRAKWRPGELATKPKDETRLRFNYTRQVVDRIDRDPDHRNEIIHRIRAGHYGGLTFIDTQLEGILKALENRGILDETLILFSSDHGSLLGDHDLIHKGTIYDASARVPFIVRAPGRIRAGKTAAFAGHVDLVPTLLSFAGAPLPADLEGRDLSPVLLGKAPSVQKHVIIEIRGGTGIITDRWKMMVYPKDGDGALYDLAADPDELQNLFGDSRLAGVRRQLLETMKKANPALGPSVQQAAPPVQDLGA